MRNLWFYSGLSVVLFLCGCGKKPEASSKAPVTPAAISIRTAQVQSRTIDRSVSVTGSLLPDETITLSSEVAGRVQNIYFDFGQTVKKRQVVAQLDATEYRLAHEQAKSALSQAWARMGLDANAPDGQKETAAMKQARAQLEDARSKYQSAAQLVKTGDISQERFTELEKTWHARQAAFEATRDDMRTQLASIDGLRAQVDLTQKRINDCTLRAPFDGAISERNVSPGQYTKENTAIVTLVKTSPLRLRADLPETVSDLVKVGSTLDFTTDAAPGVRFHAIVRELNPALDAKSRTLTVEARMQNADSRLRPGLFVQVQLVTQPNTPVVVVPPEALYRLAGVNKIFVIRNGKAHALRVDAPQTIDNWVEVPGDVLHAGDSVAVSNLEMLIDGAAVETGRI